VGGAHDCEAKKFANTASKPGGSGVAVGAAVGSASGTPANISAVTVSIFPHPIYFYHGSLYKFDPL